MKELFEILPNYNARIYNEYPTSDQAIEGLRLAIHRSGDGTNKPTSFTEGRTFGTTYWNTVTEKMEFHIANGQWTEDIGYKTSFSGDLDTLSGNNVYYTNANVTNGPEFQLSYVINIIGAGNSRSQLAIGRASNRIAIRYFNGTSWTPWREIGAVLSGSSTNRPATNVVGLQFFDTSLGHPIWWNGTAWADANGMIV